MLTADLLRREYSRCVVGCLLFEQNVITLAACSWRSILRRRTGDCRPL